MENLENLANDNFNSSIDKKVKEELQLAGIPVISLPYYMLGEVKTHYIGILNGFMFYRKWAYWVCKGNMPLVNAKEIYTLNKSLCIRADGDCGHVEPEKAAYSLSYENACKKLKDKIGLKRYLQIAMALDEPEKYPELDAEQKAEFDKLQNMEKGDMFVRSYHIDTLPGLDMLSKYIKENKLHAK